MLILKIKCNLIHSKVYFPFVLAIPRCGSITLALYFFVSHCPKDEEMAKLRPHRHQCK